jgi:hypothetical protein
MKSSIPLLLIINKDHVVEESYVCRDGADLEELFKQELADRGRNALDRDFENGSITMECGTTIVMTWARKSNDYGLPKVGDIDPVWCCQCNAMVDAEVLKTISDKVFYRCENNHEFSHQ